MGGDCKSAGSAFEGSNPSPATTHSSSISLIHSNNSWQYLSAHWQIIIINPMRRILLALPLFLVVGLAFVELPVSGTSPTSVQTNTNTGSAETAPVASDPMGISAPVAAQAVKTKINLNPNSGDLFTKGNHEDDEGDDDDYDDEEDEDDED